MADPLNKPRVPPKEAVALGGALLFLAIGFAAILAVAKIADVEDGIVLASLLIIPALVYLLLSGRISEFRGPGGLEFKLKEAAKQSIKPVRFDTLPVDEVATVAKGGPESLTGRLKDIPSSRTVVMTMVLGKELYDPAAVAEYVKTLSQIPRFRFVCFLDEEGRLVAYMEGIALRDMLEVPTLGQHLVNLIRIGDVGELRRFPGVLTKTFNRELTVGQALRDMEELRLNALPVTDAEDKLRGVIERERLVSALLLGIVE